MNRAGPYRLTGVPETDKPVGRVHRAPRAAANDNLAPLSIRLARMAAVVAVAALAALAALTF